MIREVTLDEISDGRLYGLNDMVKADCYDCKGCFACCQGMGSSIILTPYDIYLLTVNLKCSFAKLMAEKIELGVNDGVILPNIKMTKEQEKCPFLNEEGRCSIHSFRPGLCRLFPLGRHYDESGIKYFLQTYECAKDNRGKVKVSKWIDVPEVKKHEEFILRWHDIIKNIREYVQESSDHEQAKAVNMRFLQIFFMMPYEEGDFYTQIEERFGMWQ